MKPTLIYYTPVVWQMEAETPENVSMFQELLV
jgi:hypothetical protein